MGTITRSKTLYATPRGVGQERIIRNLSKQAFPIDRKLILPYHRLQLKLHSASVKGRILWPLENGLPVFFDNNYIPSVPVCASEYTYASPAAVLAKDRAVNRARDKFMSSMHERAEWFVNLAERREALRMVGKRGAQLGVVLTTVAEFALSPRRSVASFYRNLRNLVSAANRKRMRRAIERWREGSKNFASLWLELHFGWEPLVRDIYASYEVLSQEPDFSWLKKGAGRVPYNRNGREYRTSKSYWEYEDTGTAEAWVFGLIQVTDPNLYKTQRLGLTNPVLWAWELIPFSFVVDWFFTVGTWLAQWDEFLGIELKSAGYSVRIVTKVDGKWVEPDGSCSGISTSLYFGRFNTFPSVKLRSYQFKGFSPERGATAIALLVQLLGKTAPARPTPTYERLFNWDATRAQFYKYEA